MTVTPQTLSVSDLHVHYGKVCAVRDVCFCAEAGTTVAIVGRNGAGKSTLLKALAGVVEGLSGTVSWDGKRLDSGTRKQTLSYLPQREEVDWDFPITVRGLAEMGLYPRLGLWKRFGKVEAAAVEQALERIGIADLANRRIGELSGGQQQRAFLARALVSSPRILLLDEPFAGLDVEATGKLSEMIRSLADEGRLILASHHDLKTVEENFEKALLLRTRQIFFGPVDQAISAETLREVFG